MSLNREKAYRERYYYTTLAAVMHFKEALSLCGTFGTVELHLKLDLKNSSLVLIKVYLYVFCS